MLQEKFNNSINELLSNNPQNKIAIAVSGGSDSIALLYFASNWSKKTAITLTIFYVDHNLRPESKDEISFIAGLCKDMRHDFIPLSWDPVTKTAIQERAREARYTLMAEKCHKLGIRVLLTAHHMDDILETYLMRKSKKSGTLGLSTSITAFYNDIQILRPLSSLFKEELVSYLEKGGIKWMEDSSNKSDLYERNRVRMELAKISYDQKIGLIKEIHRVDERASELNNNLITAIAESVQMNNYGFAKIDLKKYQLFDLDVRIQVLTYVITVISGKTTIPRFRNISNILALKDGIESTLHGCALKETKGKLLIFREKSSIVASDFSRDGNCFWDKRFDINIQNTGEDYFVDKLSSTDYTKIKTDLNIENLVKISNNNHKAILFTLPVIKNLEKVVAIPHISYYDDIRLEGFVEIIFRPGFISRFTHFL